MNVLNCIFLDSYNRWKCQESKSVAIFISFALRRFGKRVTKRDFFHLKSCEISREHPGFLCLLPFQRFWNSQWNRLSVQIWRKIKCFILRQNSLHLSVSFSLCLSLPPLSLSLCDLPLFLPLWYSLTVPLSVTLSLSLSLCHFLTFSLSLSLSLFLCYSLSLSPLLFFSFYVTQWLSLSLSLSCLLSLFV